MTDEELRKNEEMNKFIEENGYAVKSVSTFMKLDNNDLEKVVSDLNAYKIEMNKKVTTEDFGKELASGLEEIENVVNSDSYFAMSANATEFKNLLDRLKNETKSVLGDYLKAEKILNEKVENLKDINKRIFILDKDQTISDEDRTKQAILLKQAKEKAEKDKEDAMKFMEEQKRLAPEPKAMSLDEIINYRNDLLKSLAELDKACSKIIMDPLSNPSTMEKLSQLIRNASYKIVVFGTDIERSKKEFDNLCAKCGLGEKDVKTKEKVEIVEETESLDEEPTNQALDDTPITKDPTKDNSIDLPENLEFTTVEELINELKKLNPDVEVITNVEGYPEGIIVEDPSKLVIPKGFKYTEGLGINNKVDDTKPYINAFTKVKERKNGIDDVIDKVLKANPNASVKSKSQKDATSVDLEVDDLDKLVMPEGYEFDANKKQIMKKTDDGLVETGVFVKQKAKDRDNTSRIPSGPLKVKKTRTAVVAPYVKAAITYAALGVVALSAVTIVATPITTGLLAGGAIGLVGQGIYTSLVNAGVLDAPNPEEYLNNTESELPVFGSGIVRHAKALLEKIKENRNKKRESVKEESQVAPEVVETPELNEQALVNEENLSETEEKNTPLENNFSNMFQANLDAAIDSPKQKTDSEGPEIKPEEYNINSQNPNNLGPWANTPAEPNLYNFYDEEQSRGGMKL